MSAGAEGRGSGHDGGHAAGRSGLKDYLTGFGLSVALTALPFWLVMAHALDKASTEVSIIALAAAQIVVHMIYFLHMNTKSEGGWNILALIFTVILVFIALSGSLWVMYHLTTNMAPMPDLSQTP